MVVAHLQAEHVLGGHQVQPDMILVHGGEDDVAGLVHVVVGQLHFVEGDVMLHPVRSSCRAVRVDIHPEDSKLTLFPKVSTYMSSRRKYRITSHGVSIFNPYSHLGGIWGSALPATAHSLPEYLYLKHKSSKKVFSSFSSEKYSQVNISPVLLREDNIHEDKIVLGRFEARCSGAHGWEHPPGKKSSANIF